MKSKFYAEVTLGSCGEFRNGLNFNYKQEGPGLPILKVKDFGNKFFVPENGLDEIDPNLINVTDNYILKSGDIVIIRSNGNSELVGRSLFFQSSIKIVTFSGFCIRFRPNPEKIFPLFAAYFIRSPFCRTRFSAYGSGTGIQNINQEILSNIPLKLPSINEQKKIANILKLLDDKIELNKQMNETLESIARTLFKSWFIDFDPVQAKMEGHQPLGMDNNTAKLFPGSLQDSTIGKIPESWIIKSLDQIANFLNGLALQKYPPTSNGCLPIIKIAELRKGITENSGKASIYIDEKYIVEDGDVLFSWSGSLDVCIWSGGRGALNQHLFKVTSNNYPKWFYYQWIVHHLPEFQSIAAGKATTMGHIQRQHLSDAKVLIPSEDLMQKMNKIMIPIYDKVISILDENQTLLALRDTLIPKLLSGEIWVKEAEELVEACV